ncbi:MAG: hypothetical protein WC302_00935 [Candidatus Paceibacterota bacterium]|jgi:hypothetical protein
MLLQMHHQFIDGSTRMMEQKEFNVVFPPTESFPGSVKDWIRTTKEQHETFQDCLRKWVKEVKEKYPLPEKTIWLMKEVEPCDSCLGSGEIVYGSDTEAGREVVKCDCSQGYKAFAKTFYPKGE